MTRAPSAITPSRVLLAALGAFAAVAVFLLVASNVLLLGLRLHDGDPWRWLTFLDILWRHGSDERMRRWLTLAGLAGFVAVIAPAGAILRQRRPPLHGRARFASEREIRQAGLRATNGLLLGRKNGRFLVFGGSEHVVVYAPTRAGKGVAVVIPNLLNWPGSVVVLDIKKENWRRTAGFRAAHGQEVFLFDPLEPEGRTARYNPLTHVRRNGIDLYDDLQRIAAMLYPTAPSEDPFWSKSARAAFIGIAGYIAETEGLPLTLGEVLRQLTGEADLKKHFAGVIANRKAAGKPLSSRCVSALNDFLGTSDNTFSSIRKSVTASLEIWLNPRVDLATAQSDFDLRQLGRRRMSIYLGVTPDNLARMAPLLNLFFQQVIDLHAREAPSDTAHERDPARQILLLLDEFPSLGHVSILAKAVPYLAGYGIRLLTILQSPAQLRGLYGPDGAKTLMTNHAIEIAFRPKEQDVAQELSTRFGVDTVEGRSRSRPWGLLGARATRSETLSDQARPLMLPQELKLIDAGQAFIVMGGIPPILADKIIYHEDRAFTARLLPPPEVTPYRATDGIELVQLHAELRQLSSTVAELSAVVRMRPVTDAEAADPTLLAAGAVDVDFSQITIEREHLTDDALQAFARGYIDRALEPSGA